METKRCFVISPIGANQSDVREHADAVFRFIITPATEECNVTAYRADQLQEHGRITDQMFRSILDADFCVALLTGHNPNVFYELAVAQSVGKPVVVLVEKGTELPFDVKDIRSVWYDLKPAPLFDGVYKADLVAHIRSLESQGWLVEPLLARYGIGGGWGAPRGNSVGAPSGANLDIQCSGELLDLLHVQEDGSYEKTPERDYWKGSVRNGRLRSFGSNVTFVFQWDIEDRQGQTGRFNVRGQGSLDGDAAYLTHCIEEAQGSGKRCWQGVMVLRIPKVGDIFGMWMTTNVLAAPHIALGTIRLRREAASAAIKAEAGDG